MADDNLPILISHIQIENILLSAEFNGAVDKILFFKERSNLKREVITEVAKMTTGQTQNENWYLTRKYRITASNFGSILACCARNRFPPSLFKSLMG